MLIESSGTVIVVVDASTPAAGAVDLAAEEANLREAPLIVVYACTGRTEDIRRGRSLLATAVSRAHAGCPGVAVTAELLIGTPAKALVRRAAGAAMVVLDQPVRRRRRHPPDPVLVAGLNRCGVPVLVHCPGAGAKQPVLAGLLAGDTSEPAVEFAFDQAALRGVSLIALTIGPATGDEHHDAGDLVARWSSKYPEVTVSYRVRCAVDPAVTLTAASKSAGLVVVAVPPAAAHRWPEAIGRVLMSRAGCPVALVPAEHLRPADPGQS